MNDDWNFLISKMKNEGFDYCFTKYSDWKEIKDPEFHKLLKKYKKAKINLENYIEEKHESSLIR